jgi:predicted O-methyltransferase YrrM
VRPRLTRMNQSSKGTAITVAIGAAIGISLLAMLAVLNRKDQIVGLNQE